MQLAHCVPDVKSDGLFHLHDGASGCTLVDLVPGGSGRGGGDGVGLGWRQLRLIPNDFIQLSLSLHIQC